MTCNRRSHTSLKRAFSIEQAQHRFSRHEIRDEACCEPLAVENTETSVSFASITNHRLAEATDDHTAEINSIGRHVGATYSGCSSSPRFANIVTLPLALRAPKVADRR
jgi:hypothetical protein